MRIAAIITSVLLGLVFMYSAYTKLYPIEPFEYSFVELGAGWKSSLFLARLLIGFEFVCGAFLILNLWLKRVTIPVVISVLVIFSVYLVLQIIRFGNSGNCGCFGTHLTMTPFEGIIKNIMMCGLAAFVYFFSEPAGVRTARILVIVLILASLFIFPIEPLVRYVLMGGLALAAWFFPERVVRKFNKAICIVLMLTWIAMPFILNPVNLQASSRDYEGKVNYKIELDILYNDPDNIPPKAELRQGKWIIAFFSLTCQHCRIAAKKLHLYKKRNPEMPVHMVLNGDRENLKPFFEETRADNISWSMFIGSEKFVKLSGPSLPQIFWVNNSVVEHKSNYMLMDEQEVLDWLNEK